MLLFKFSGLPCSALSIQLSFALSYHSM